ncbi:hypothetical protein Amsp01_088380 [Amycolatopsis sp. NBRC 101858]|nr:hypothetical protein Amsp01_088380 [Amycolatopsis sp. NBRC 101858]
MRRTPTIEADRARTTLVTAIRNDLLAENAPPHSNNDSEAIGTAGAVKRTVWSRVDSSIPANGQRASAATPEIRFIAGSRVSRSR